MVALLFCFFFLKKTRLLSYLLSLGLVTTIFSWISVIEQPTFRPSKSLEEGLLKWDDYSHQPPPQENWPCTCARYACRNHSAYDIDAERTQRNPQKQLHRKRKEEENIIIIPWGRLKQFKFIARHTHTHQSQIRQQLAELGSEKQDFLVSPASITQMTQHSLTGSNIPQQITKA